MRIVNLKEFLTMPDGTIFCKFEPSVFDSMCIKIESISPVDFYYCSLIGEIAGSRYSALEEPEYPSFSFDLNVVRRDGCFDENQLFAVYEDSDIENLISTLQRSLTRKPAV